jgi:superfamily II DNA or RNA helicase
LNPTSSRSSAARALFGERLCGEAEQLLARGTVRDVRILQGGAVITGVVGSARVYIRRTSDKIEGECSCRERSPCIHVVAVTLTADENGSTAAPSRLAHGTDPENNAPRRPPAPVAAPSLAAAQQQRLFYLLARSSSEIQVSIWIAQTARASQTVIPDSVHPFALRISATSAEFPRYVETADKDILKALAARKQTHGTAGVNGAWELTGPDAGGLLQQMVGTGRAFWRTLAERPLRIVQNPRPLSFAWQVLPNGDQQLHCEAAPSLAVFPQLEPPACIDPVTAEVGRFESTQPLALVREYWSHPAIAPEQVATLNARIANESFPRLKTFRVAPQALDSLAARLVLSEGPKGTLYFVYNGLPIDGDRLRDGNAAVRQMTTDVLHEIPRDHAAESRLRARLSGVLPDESRGREAWLNFLLTVLPALRAEQWDVQVEDTFPYRLAQADDWFGDLTTDQRQGWFNLRLGVLVNGQQVNLLPALARYLQTTLAGAQTTLTTRAESSPADALLAEDDAGCRIGDEWLVRLEDGRYLPIALERIQRIANTLVELFDHDGLTRQQTLSLPRSHTGRIAQLSRELRGSLLHAEALDVRALLQDLESSGGTIQPRDAPADFRARLRPYQQEGLGWLQFLRRHHLGGILADDMGLGKTVQTLAHLAVEKQQGRLTKPSLIVTPVSTLGNWQQELHRFTPELSVLVLHGSRRRESFSLIGKMDVVVTGYPVLQLDSEVLLARDYYLVILDEAQTIKNPKAKVSAIARSLRAEHRLALTGTPVENHLGELWSLFDFAQPGLLGEDRQFQRHYRTPIEKDGNHSRAQALAQRVAPFLLRRTKDAVARDLPPKTEIIETLALDERQRDFYDGIRLSSHRHIQEIVRQQGLARSQITILDALLKLRQACCDPRLLPLPAEDHEIPSAKLEWLSTALPELIAEGRRVLLFSQFTSMLRLIEAQVTELGIPYCLLTGETRNRPEVIARFQSGAVPLFLISLKAGGTGLNLTAADTVIHYDPWWNPAVEAQATDRAHRIGQDKPVFVYKLIAQDTVEERIMALQADKHALASRLFTEGGGSSAAWTAADIEALFAP